VSDERPQDATVHPAESRLVDAQHLESVLGDSGGDASVGFHLSEVTDASEVTVGLTRGAAAPSGDDLGCVLVHLDLEDPGRASHHLEDLLRGIVVELFQHPEACTEGRGEEPLARGRTDQRKRPHLDLDRPCVRALVDQNVDGVILHRGIQVLLDGDVDAVHFVDEEHVEFAELGEDAGEVGGFLENGTAGRTKLGPDLVCDDVSERGFPQSGRPGKQDVVECLAATARRLDIHPKVANGLLLTDELAEIPRTKRELFFRQLGLRELIVGHARSTGYERR